MKKFEPCSGFLRTPARHVLPSKSATRSERSKKMDSKAERADAAYRLGRSAAEKGETPSKYTFGSSEERRWFLRGFSDFLKEKKQ